MRTHGLTAKIAGVLFITATVADLISTGLLNPVLSNSHVVGTVSAHQDRVSAGAFFQIVAAFASAGIAISLYPVLRRRHPGLALGSVGFRVIEGVLYVVNAIGALLLLTLGQAFVKAGSPSSSYFETSAELLKALRDRASLMGVLAFYVGAAMYYLAFHRSRLLPRWLSDWGLVGVALGFVAGILVLFGTTGFMSTPDVVLNLPIGVNEMVLAVWLIIRGFDVPTTLPPVTPDSENALLRTGVH